MAVMSSDRRKDDRRAIDRPCWIDVGPGCDPIRGHLRNISQSGAKLVCESFDKLPDQFVLFFTADGSVGRGCKVVRRVERDIGLHFVGRKVPKPSWIQTEAAPVIVE